MPTKEEVFEKIQAALVDALGIDEEDVTPEATLVGDLGAESIDFLDIVFRLEKAFAIKIPAASCSPRTSSPMPSTSRMARSPRRAWPSCATHALRQPGELRQESGSPRLR